jgi:LysR family tcuABC transcriptional regulator
MAAILQEDERGRQWRYLSISDATISRRNYLYSLAPAFLSPAAMVVATEIEATARELVASGAWTGVRLLVPDASREVAEAA